jgi:hypothetical protein
MTAYALVRVGAYQRIRSVDEHPQVLPAFSRCWVRVVARQPGSRHRSFSAIPRAMGLGGQRRWLSNVRALISFWVEPDARANQRTPFNVKKQHTAPSASTTRSPRTARFCCSSFRRDFRR